jgi:hypothetical protein
MSFSLEVKHVGRHNVNFSFSILKNDLDLLCIIRLSVPNLSKGKTFPALKTVVFGPFPLGFSNSRKNLIRRATPQNKS